MPIRPENRKRYPKDWKAISQRIRFERAGGRCECEGACGIDHNGDPTLDHQEDYVFGRCSAMHGEAHPDTRSRVVLTVAHLDHQPENNDDANLKAMCQRCHNRYDAPMRRKGIRQRRHENMACGDLFP